MNMKEGTDNVKGEIAIICPHCGNEILQIWRENKSSISFYGQLNPKGYYCGIVCEECDNKIGMIARQPKDVVITDDVLEEMRGS